jgi:uncharacterized FlaG/YvyC family protein
MSSVTMVQGRINNNMVSLGEKMSQALKVAANSSNLPRVYQGDRVMEEISEKTRQRIINKLDKYSDFLNSKVKFQYDPQSKQIIAEIIDSEGNVRESIPTKEMINFSQKARRFISQLLGKI